MSKHETVLAELRKACQDAMDTDEEKAGIDGIFEEYAPALEKSATVGGLATLEALAKLDSGIGQLVKAAGEDEALLKSLTDVAEFAHVLHMIECMMERLQAICDGKQSFPSMLMPDQLDEEDRLAQQEHAEALLGILVPFFRVGLLALQRMTGAVITEEEQDADADDPAATADPEAAAAAVAAKADADAGLAADLSILGAGLAKADVNAEDLFERLTKADPGAPVADARDTAAADAADATDDGTTDDDGDLDPLETIKRLAAAIMLQISAIQGTDEDDTDTDAGTDAGADAGAAVPAAAAKADGMAMANAVKAQLAPMLKSIESLKDRNDALEGLLTKLAGEAAPGAKGALAANDGGKGGDNDTLAKLEDLAKVDPKAAVDAVFRAALAR